MKKIKTKYTLRADGRIMLRETINGERKCFYGASDAEVEQKRDRYLAEMERANTEGRSFSMLADEWWALTEPRLSPNSVNTYKGAYNRAVEHFGGKGVKSITPRDIYLYLGAYAAQAYSQKVISRHKSVLISIFDYAFMSGDVDVNPCAGIPAVKGKPKQMREPATEKDIELIEEHKTDSNFGRMMYFMLYTGCRRGEAAALQFKHLDRANNTADIIQSVAFDTAGKPILKSPKTAAGKRQIVVPDRVLAILPEGAPEQFVFFPDGLPGQHELERGLKRFQDANGIAATAHQLRHAYASMLFSADNLKLKDSQHLLGHSSEKLTADIYTHIEKRHEADVKNKVKEYIDNR